MQPPDFHSGVPSLRGAAKYVVIIRAKGDPERSPRPSSKSDPDHALAWKKKVQTGTPEEWADRIVKLLSDGVHRTFNRIVVELADTTADVAFGERPEQGLWLAVERGDLMLTHEAPILFTTALKVARRRPAPEKRAPKPAAKPRPAKRIQSRAPEEIDILGGLGDAVADAVRRAMKGLR
jgi:hypothetical protein